MLEPLRKDFHPKIFWGNHIEITKSSNEGNYNSYLNLLLANFAPNDFHK